MDLKRPGVAEKEPLNPADGHIVAFGGGGFSMEPDNPLLDDFVLGLSRCGV
jgi:hypothetical protein